MKRNLMNRSVLKVLKKNVGISILLLFSIGGVVIASLIPPQILKYIVDHNLVPHKSEHLLVAAVSYVGVLLFIGIFDFAKEAILTILGQKITKEIRIGMMEKMERMNARFFSNNSSGTVVSRFTNDVDAINSLFTGGIIGMMVDCLKIIGILFSIWMFSGKLGIVTLFLLPVIFGITRLFQKRMLKAQIENRILIGRVNNHISESLKNIQMIKSYSKESYMEENYKKQLIDNYKTVEKVNFYDSIYAPFIQLIRAVVIAFIVVLSSKQLNILGISLGMIAASIELFSNLFSPVENLGMELQNIQQAVSGMKRVNDFFDELEDDCKKEITSNELIPDREKVQLSFQDLTFSYEEDSEVIQNMSLDLRPNEKVTFVGRTGVGKTTLFKLIMGILKPTSGRITINGVDVNDIPNTEKRKIFGFVDQSFHLIKGTVAEQISLQDESISRAQIKKALNFVGLAEYVGSLENGIDTLVTSEALFSHGQKQLLSIARAIVTNPPILLLDEITSNLDSITEEKIVSVLQKASEKHTILSISHRLSTIVASDRVVILEHGKIKGVGSPEELLESDEWYRSHIALEKLTWN
ncbi:MAG: ABC transporter ATP-binding protein [Lachnospiraceae bacterium]|nr:ABC transporter ATP-binding protein [Lachnospiraceae bacterium]